MHPNSKFSSRMFFFFNKKSHKLFAFKSSIGRYNVIQCIWLLIILWLSKAFSKCTYVLPAVKHENHFELTNTNYDVYIKLSKLISADFQDKASNYSMKLIYIISKVKLHIISTITYSVVQSSISQVKIHVFCAKICILNNRRVLTEVNKTESDHCIVVLWIYMHVQLGIFEQGSRCDCHLLVWFELRCLV